MKAGRQAGRKDGRCLEVGRKGERDEGRQAGRNAGKQKARVEKNAGWKAGKAGKDC